MISQRIIPTVFEFMDRLCMDCVQAQMRLPLTSEAQALLLIEVDGERIVIDQQSKRIEEVCRKEGALTFETALGEEDAERIWEARRHVSPSLYRLRPHKISEDVVVPRSRLPALVEHLSHLTETYGLPIAAFGHAGDGNLHVNIMHDREVPGESERALVVVKEIFRRVIELEGTLTGEHGIGITKAPYLGMEIPPAGIALMTRIKKSFDPNGILNPGKVLPPFPAARPR
jgi:glycolate oxidase